MARFRNRLRGLRDRWRAGTLTEAEVCRRIDAWIAHAEQAHTPRASKGLFEGGWFDPEPSKTEERGPGLAYTGGTG